MESYSHSSSSSSTFLFLNSSQEEKKSRPPQPPVPSSYSSLHSVRKLPAKPWKKFIAPLPPTRPRVYKVDSINFKELVQKLTGAPELQSRRLQSVAPPPLSLSKTISDTDISTASPLQLLPSPPNKTPLSATFRDLMTETLNPKPRKFSDTNWAAVMSPLGFTLSPSSHACVVNSPAAQLEGTHGKSLEVSYISPWCKQCLRRSPTVKCKFYVEIGTAWDGYLSQLQCTTRKPAIGTSKCILQRLLEAEVLKEGME
ncbi:hypothetical protein F0562_006257 [Nyssa sinensis]|uniref:VQ domain-containing protein n=1 Tax=Nyssa sinensis TaxID=561372 RepID=A0A5J5AMV8_9ASTE|nr:hypothetical protein F0562_006257 [Nyssa sinensis]